MNIIEVVLLSKNTRCPYFKCTQETFMSRIPILAYPIKDLTIARYLAAKEIEYFGIDFYFKLETEMEELVKSWKEWVEGPIFIGFGADKTLLEKFRKDQLIAGYVIDNHFFSDQAELNKIFEERVFYFENDIDGDKLIGSITRKNDVNFSTKEKLWIINPGLEKKTGIYNFDELDELLETMGRS